MRILSLAKVVAIVFIGLSSVFFANSARAVGESSSIISSKIMPDKNEYYLGEIISVETRMTNNTSKPIYVGGDSKNGTVIKIAFNEDKNYKTYSPPGLGYTLDGINIPETVAPHKTRTWKEKILWNNNPDVSNLNPDAAKPFTDGKILTDYAMPEVGNYFVKFCAMIDVNGQRRYSRLNRSKSWWRRPRMQILESGRKLRRAGRSDISSRSQIFPEDATMGRKNRMNLLARFKS